MGKRYIPPIEGERIRLRLLEEADLPLTLAWRNQDHIRKWFLHSDIVGSEQHQTWYEQYRTRDDDFVFIIEETRPVRRPIGQVSLYRIDREAKRAEFGRLMIGEADAQGKGLAKQATQLLLEVAFDEFGLNEVYLEVFKHNTKAIAIYQKCGFQVCDENNDRLVMNLFRAHFRAARGREE